MEEWAVEGSTAVLTCYTLGDDVIAQKKTYWQWVVSQWELQSTGNTQYLLYDGHGSTRQLAEYNTEVTIADRFSYDAYGVLLQNEDNFPPNGAQDPGKVAQQATSLLYAGEQFDTDSQHYYNRARWYNLKTGLYYTNGAKSYDLYILRFLQSGDVNCISSTIQARLLKRIQIPSQPHSRQQISSYPVSNLKV